VKPVPSPAISLRLVKRSPVRAPAPLARRVLQEILVVQRASEGTVIRSTDNHTQTIHNRTQTAVRRPDNPYPAILKYAYLTEQSPIETRPTLYLYHFVSAFRRMGSFRARFTRSAAAVSPSPPYSHGEGWGEGPSVNALRSSNDNVSTLYQFVSSRIGICCRTPQAMKSGAATVREWRSDDARFAIWRSLTPPLPLRSRLPSMVFNVSSPIPKITLLAIQKRASRSPYRFVPRRSMSATVTLTAHMCIILYQSGSSEYLRHRRAMAHAAAHQTHATAQVRDEHSKGRLPRNKATSHVKERSENRPELTAPRRLMPST
jgi:hypothetical protein